MFPFSVVYGFIVWLIELSYAQGICTSRKSPVFSIGVGNITVGGTGKTPHTEFLIDQFLGKHTIATLSRGYGRKTKGFLAVTDQLGPAQVGDEPWQFFLKFGSRVKVNVGEKRVEAAEKIHALYPSVDLLLMDDVFQHHAIQADFNILLCDYTNPFFKDYPFPAGRLREFRSGAKRADVIIVSKCPCSLSETEKQYFRKALHRYAPQGEVFFSAFVYGEAVPIFKTTINTPSSWVLVTGIANPKPLRQHLEHHNALLKHLEYADHHNFSDQELEEIVSTYKGIKASNAGVLLTEKDYARLTEAAKNILKDVPLFYIPITVQLLEYEDLFWRKIMLAMQDHVTFQHK